MPSRRARYILAAASVLILVAIALRPGADREVILYTHEDRNSLAYDLYVIGEDGTGKRSATELPASDDYGVWSPDGTRFAFQSDRAGDGIDVYVMDAGIARRVTSMPGDDM